MPGAPEDYEKMSETAKPMSRYKTTAGILIAVAALIAGLVPLLGYESPGGCDGRGRQKGEAMIDNLIRNFLYYPIVRDSQDKLPGYIRGADEVWMNSSDGNRIHALHWPAPAGRPTILFFHGNAQSVFEWALIVEEFESMECGLLLVDYPGYGKSTGSPSEAGLYASGQAAWNWLVSEAKIAPEFIVAFGKSLGGPVASKVAHDNRVMGLVLESTFMSIPAVAQRLIPMLPADAVFRSERYDTGSRIGELTVPVLVVHGTQDELIPLSQGNELFDAAVQPKRLYLVEGAGHNDVSMVAGRTYGATLRQWLDEIEGFSAGQ